MNWHDEILNHQKARVEHIQKAVSSTPDSLEKAKQPGDMNPDGTKIWTEYQPGKFDWRRVSGKKGKAAVSATQSGVAKPSTPAPDKVVANAKRAIGDTGKTKTSPLLKQSKLSSAEYSKAKKLAGFDAKNYKWDSNQDLYVKVDPSPASTSDKYSSMSKSDFKSAIKNLTFGSLANLVQKLHKDGDGEKMTIAATLLQKHPKFPKLVEMKQTVERVINTLKAGGSADAIEVLRAKAKRLAAEVDIDNDHVDKMISGPYEKWKKEQDEFDAPAPKAADSGKTPSAVNWRRSNSPAGGEDLSTTMGKLNISLNSQNLKLRAKIGSNMTFIGGSNNNGKFDSVEDVENFLSANKDKLENVGTMNSLIKIRDWK